jgi:hypothetical protein
MLENVDVFIIIYVVVLIIQGYISFLRKSLWGMLPIIISSIIFITSTHREVFILLILQVSLFSVIRFTKYIIESFLSKSRNRKIDKSKIHDL